ncbi:S9 family peptidase [Biformimicrobium ophioploci]|uniref:S9 family peptidase n=1 Tax=Biformimicrobium ophioploci TaxID=3036711 RepID=A0ABQ6M1F7_9GAMM|nr:prolyl oligopeptidase family serine peptidase [Microbulbifer sp. NKW57]GMG88100.1 S9 family peptidase [Microbulbifer sp. NKW57]
MAKLESNPSDAPYGSWQSPVSADLLAGAQVRLAETQMVEDRVYWLETRPAEKGRCVLVEFRDGEFRDINPAPISIRSRAHEYGGGSYLATAGEVFFVAGEDQRIYRLALVPGAVPEVLTPELECRYADLTLDPHRNRLLAVQELAGDTAHTEEKARLVAIDLARPQSAPEVLASGADFYSTPRISPDGMHFAFLRWYHPNMPWDGTELVLATLDAKGAIKSEQVIAGDSNESIFQPEWSPRGELIFVSDRNDWWNLYAWRNGECSCLWERPAEFATPQWVFGMRTYGFTGENEILCCFTEDGSWSLARLNLRDGSHAMIESDCRDIQSVSCSHANGAFIGGSATSAPAIYRLHRDTPQQPQPIHSSARFEIDPGYISVAEPETFDCNGRKVHGFHYPPTNRDYRIRQDQAPPLIVLSHGGPTGATETGLNLKIQYWTSRGFAVFDVNYSGSTGYGRAYRERLAGNWGILDVEEVCAAARMLVERGLANPSQLAIKGSSAGGYTVLAALTFHDTFNAGTVLYGIGDLSALAQDTHKFESRYLDKLVGPWPAAEETYRARSPIHHIEKLDCPVIFFQGLEDKVVPPAQAQTMVEALRAKRIPVAYVPFAEEGHGFRQGQNIKAALEGELYFYSNLFDFPYTGPKPDIEIQNAEFLRG